MHVYILQVYTATFTPKPAYGIGLGEYQHHLHLPHKAFRQKILITYVLLADTAVCLRVGYKYGCICCFVSASAGVVVIVWVRYGFI